MTPHQDPAIPALPDPYAPFASGIQGYTAFQMNLRWLDGYAAGRAAGVQGEAVAEMVVARQYHEYENSAKEDTEGFLHSFCIMHAASLKVPEGRYPLYTAPQAETLAVAEGLSLAQEPKYTVNGSAIVNRASGEAIPADEPVFIFRARDLKALYALNAYAGCLLEETSHRSAVVGRIQEFKDFAATHPERMKQPDTTPTPTASIAQKGEGAAS